MKNKIKKYLSLFILVPTLVLSPIQTQAFAITATVTLGMFVNFLVSTVIVGGVIYEFTNGAPDMGYTEIKDTLNKKDTSLYKYNNSSLLSVKSATDLVTLGLTPLEAKTITDAYDEYCDYYETVDETVPYTFKKTEVFKSTVTLAKSLNFVVSKNDYPTINPGIILDSQYVAVDNGLTPSEYNDFLTWDNVYYYVFLGGTFGSASNYNKLRKGEISSFVPYVYYFNKEPVISVGTGISFKFTASDVVGLKCLYQHITWGSTSEYGLRYKSVVANDNFMSSFAVTHENISWVVPPEITNTSTSYDYAFLVATNDERVKPKALSYITPTMYEMNMIGFKDMPFVNDVYGYVTDKVIDIAIPYQPVSSVTVLPGAIASSPTSVDDYKNSIVADESFSLTMPAEEVVDIPVDTPTDWGWWSWLSDWCREFWENLTGVLERTFVPSTTYFDTAFEDVNEKFNSKFPIVKDLNDFFKSITNVDYVSKCPRFTITLPKAWGGGTHDIIDFSLYNDYRSYVLLFFRGILWFGFLKKLYKKLPDVIY